MTTQKNRLPQGEAAQDVQPAEEGPELRIPTPGIPVGEQSANGEVDPPGEVVYNPLRLDKLRSKCGVLKGVWTDPSRVQIWTRPEANTWVRLRPGEEYSDVLDLLVATNASNSSDRNPLYVAVDEVRPEMDRFIKPHRIGVGITYHDKVVFLWARSVGTSSNSWNDSVMRAMDKAGADWISLESDMANSEYKIHTAPRTKEWGEPKWPDQTLEDVVGLAFRDRIIDSMEHAVVKRLLGRD